MERNSTTLLANGKGYAAGMLHPLLDLRSGGQMGFGPDMTELISSAVHVRRPVVPILLRAPSGFLNLPNPEYWIGTLRALMEEGYQSIDGLRGGREYEFSSTPVGGAGEIQEDIINATIPRSEVTYNFRERQGMPMHAFWSGYGDKLMMDPNIKYASVATLGDGPSDMLPDRYTFSMLYFEPDPTHRYVVNAWVGDYMMPKNGGSFEGKRDMTAAAETIDYSMPFTGVYMCNTLGVKTLAQSVLNSIRIVGADPNLRGAGITGVAANVAATRTGYGQQIEKFRATAVKL